MKLNKEQIQTINNRLLKEDKIYDELVRIELIDHIASSLEATDLPFEESFKKYWNSREKVLLITESKKQIESKKGQVETYFWKQFVKPFTIFLVIILFVFLQKTEFTTEILKNIVLILMIIILIFFIGVKFLSRQKYFYTKFLSNSISIFYIISLQVSRFYLDKIAENTIYTGLFLTFISLYVLSFWFFYKAHLFGKSINTIKILQQ